MNKINYLGKYRPSVTTLMYIAATGLHLRMKKATASAVICLALATPASLSAEELPLNKLKLPDGFKIAVYAKAAGARSMTLGDDGTVYVGTRDNEVYAVINADKDGQSDKVVTIAKDLRQPNGVAYRNGDLYVAEISQIRVFKGIAEQLKKAPKTYESNVLPVKFPDDKHHGWKFIAFGPDDKLYVPVGAPCNVCDKGDDYSAIFQVDAEGKGKTLFAKGIRNTVGFAWHPETKVLYFTENGRDMMGDNLPEDELNKAEKPGLDFGFPECHADGVADPDFGRDPNACKNSEKPITLLGPHVAALGMRFYTGSQFPNYRHKIFIAQHGSWNRTEPAGYQIVTVTLDKNGKGKMEPFITGWLGNIGGAWGRPVDVLELPDGSLLISDDHADVIYRVTYAKK